MKCYRCKNLLITGLDGWDEILVCYCLKKQVPVEPDKVTECEYYEGD